jgi:peptidyl-prolyl cis-trans isomerase SurA
MTKRRTLLFAVTALLVTLVANLEAAADKPVVVDRVVAIVNDDIITLSDLQREAARVGRGKADDRAILDEMINRKLQLVAAKRNALDVTEKELDEAIEDIKRRNGSMSDTQFEAALAKEGLTLEQYRAELREQMTLSRTFNKFVRSGLAVEEPELRSYYEKNAANYSLPEEIRVRQVVIKLPDNATNSQLAAARERAQDVARRAKNGEDFIGLVKEYSQDGTATLDGDLGFLSREHVLPEIATAASTLEPGGIAGPLQSSDGFRIIKLEGVRKPIRPFSEVKDEIANAVFQQKIETTYRAWLQSLRSEAHIENRL